MQGKRAIEGARQVAGISCARIADSLSVGRCGVLRRLDTLALAEVSRRSGGKNSRALGTEYELIGARRKPWAERHEHCDYGRLLPVMQCPVPGELTNKRDSASEPVSLGGHGRVVRRYFLGAVKLWSRQRVRGGGKANVGGTSRNLGIGPIKSEAREWAIESRTSVTRSAARFRFRLEQLVRRSRSRQLRSRTLTGAKAFPTSAKGLLPCRGCDSQPGALDAQRVQLLPVAHSSSPATLSCFDRQVPQRFRPSMSIEPVRRDNSPKTADRQRPSDAAHHPPLPPSLHRSLRDSPREDSRGPEPVDLLETLLQAVQSHPVVAIPHASPLPMQAVQPDRATAGSLARLAHVAIRGLLSQAGHRLHSQSARLELAATPCAYSPRDSAALVPCSRATFANTAPDTPSADGERP